MATSGPTSETSTPKLKQKSVLTFFGKTDQSKSGINGPEKRKISKETYEKEKRSRSFIPKWKEDFDGLVDSESGMLCTLCQTFKNISDASSSFLTGNKTYRVDSIKAHFSSPKHLACVQAALVQQRVDDGEPAGPMDVVIQKIGEKNKTVLSHLFNTAYFVMKEELPFTKFPSMVKLQVKNGSDLSRLMSYLSDKACARFAPHISGSIRDSITEEIQNADVLSVMFDGATDCAISEVEIVYCRICIRGVVKNFFIGLEDLEHAHAQGTFEAIDRAMTKFGCNNWKDKLIALGSDGAKVNVGVNDSVATRMKADGRGYVLAVHCIAHRLELGVLNAIKDNNLLATVHDMLNKIHKHYHYSPKALRELREIADALDERVIKPTRLQGTRWVPHIFKAIKSLCSCYSVILAHFEHVSQARPGQTTAAVVGRATFMVNKLKDWRILRFMFFMHDLLDIISILSLSFQRDEGTCIDFLDALETANLSLVQLGQQPGEQLQSFIDSLTINANGNCVYKNTVLTHYNANADYRDLQVVIEAVADRINGRLENNNDPVKPILQAARVFDVKDWPDDRLSLAPYGNAEVRQLSDHFSDVLDNMGCDRNQLQNEWRDVKAHFKNLMGNHPRGQNQNMPKINSLFRYINRFTNIKCLVQIVLTLPVSSAICERGFSCVKRVKSDWRASLTTTTMNYLLTISIEGPSLDAYDAELALHRWWTHGRSKRPKFAPEQGDDDDEDALLAFLLQNNQ